jgi:SAM-dependent methyltransferase
MGGTTDQLPEEILKRHREVWQRKTVLRVLYTSWYEDIASYLQPGRTLEVGGGTGNLKEFASSVICTDVVSLPWLDLIADAQRLPIASGSLANLVLFDVLHHIEQVRLFFDEALRVLQPGGRIVVMDPYISWASWPVYHFLHPEPVDFTQDVLRPQPARSGRDPFDANQAVATMLFERDYERFRGQYPSLRLRMLRRLAMFAYPLSGGFDHPSLLPAVLVRPMLAVERALEFLGRWFAFRMLVVLEKGS